MFFEVKGTQYLSEQTQMFCEHMQSFWGQFNIFKSDRKGFFVGTQYFCERTIMFHEWMPHFLEERKSFVIKLKISEVN